MSQQLAKDIEAAVKKLRPNAEYTMLGHTFTEWKDLTGQSMPTWEEIEAEIKKANS